VPDRPKALAEIGGRPFLDILLDELQSQGLRRFILCTGHGAEQIAARYRGREGFAFSAEDRPLGTGGAIAHASPHIRTDPFIAVNGDSFCRVSYAALLEFHRARNAVLTIVGVARDGRGDVGAIRADGDRRVLSFQEKMQGGYASAGIYVMTGAVLAAARKKTPCSLEFDVFPDLARAGQCYVFPVDAALVDIGTPERLRAAHDFLR
jgi:NDP-sugar pyrophosphorylase family protein